MVDSQSQIVFTATTVAFHTSAELIQVDMTLHVIQICGEPKLMEIYLQYQDHLNSKVRMSVPKSLLRMSGT